MSSDMSGSVAVITGGSGIVGSGIIYNFLQRGCRVIAPCRTEKAVKALKDEVDEALQSKLTVSIVDIAYEAACKDLAQTVRDKHGTVDHVVCCVGGFQQPGELSQQTGAKLREHMDTYAVPQLHVYTAFLPILKDEEGSSYTFITGSLGGTYMPGVSLLTACVGCIFGMSTAARGECESKKLRVNEFRLGARVEKHTDCVDTKKGSHDCRTNGKLVADLAQSTTRGEVVHVSDQDLHDAASKVDIGLLDAAGVC